MGILTVTGLLTALCILAVNGQSQVCYEDIGCFVDECVAQPFPPDHPAVVNTRFFLYTRDNPTGDGQELIANDYESLNGSNYDPAKKTKFTIHGWRGSSQSDGEVKRRDAFLIAEDCNVIMVDWRDGASGSDYPQDASNSRVAGRETGLMIQFLGFVGMQYSDVHLVGHSLGAHVAGYAGAYVYGEVDRITGTDPAGPSFVENTDVKCRLDPSDAQFVDVIHTDAGELGISTLSGHQDYFPNGGELQPGCTPVSDVGGCSHAFADEFFNESIVSICKYWAYPCVNVDAAKDGLCTECLEGCSEMGYHADEYEVLHGVFYLATNAAKPYCI